MAARIFVVDDEPDLLDFYVNALEWGGYEIFGRASDGAEAVERLTTDGEIPDLIIMDHRMPVKNGLDASREILARFPSARIILATADRGTVEEAGRLGVTDFKKKPFTLDHLLENIAQSLAPASLRPPPPPAP